MGGDGRGGCPCRRGHWHRSSCLTTSSISELDAHIRCPMRLARFYSRFTDRKTEAAGLSGAGSTQLGSGGGGTYSRHWGPSSSHGLTQPFSARLLQAAPTHPQATGPRVPTPSRFPVTAVPPQGWVHQAEVPRGRLRGAAGSLTDLGHRGSLETLTEGLVNNLIPTPHLAACRPALGSSRSGGSSVKKKWK